MPIRQLAPDVAAKIAAGEVVERPASVVKELIENSIDAGATQIRVDLMHGGLQLIRVTDNGCGIAVDELPLALTRHATSKVSGIDDLEHIRSLGFRGEALASIAAVAEVTLVSRKRGESQGAQVEAQNGQMTQPVTAASPEGTAITVRNLFSAVPARLKFIKSRNTEVSHCHHLLEKYALAYPEIRFNVFSDGRQIFSTPGDGKLTSVLVEVYGLQIAEQMVSIDSGERPEDPEYPVVTGYVSRPACYKSTGQHISFFVNRRWVMSHMLTSAVRGAYHSLLLSGRFPLAVVNIRIDPGLLDVNVHPAKTEIRFLKDRRVFAAILRAVREALLVEPSMPQWQPKTPSRDNAATLSATSVEDEILGDDLDLDEAGEITTEVSEKAEDEESTRLSAYPRDNPWMTVTEEVAGTTPPMPGRLWQSHIHSPSRERENAAAARLTGRNKSTTSPTEPVAIEQEIAHTQHIEAADDAGALETEEVHTEKTRTYSSISTSPMSPIEQLWTREQEASNASSTIAPALPVQSTLEERTIQQPQQGMLLDDQRAAQAIETVDPRQRSVSVLPRLRVVGQVSQSYIVTEGEDGMYLIDQHAAHERILLERMVTSLKARASMAQLLLTPIKLELSPQEVQAIEEHQKQLEHIGFTLEMHDDSTIEVKAVPTVLVKQMNARSLHELLIDITNPESLGDTETWEERALANVACKAAIKANYFLTVSEMREMLEQLEQTKAPFSCCHGRPTMVHFGLTALAHAFERR